MRATVNLRLKIQGVNGPGVKTNAPLMESRSMSRVIYPVRLGPTKIEVDNTKSQ